VAGRLVIVGGLGIFAVARGWAHHFGRSRTRPDQPRAGHGDPQRAGGDLCLAGAARRRDFYLFAVVAGRGPALWDLRRAPRRERGFLWPGSDPYRDRTICWPRRLLRREDSNPDPGLLSLESPTATEDEPAPKPRQFATQIEALTRCRSLTPSDSSYCLAL